MAERRGSVNSRVTLTFLLEQYSFFSYMAARSRTSIASLLVAIALAVVFFGYLLGEVIFAGLGMTWEAWEKASVWVVWACSLFLAVGVPLGIMALREEGRSKRLSVIALALQALVAVLFVAVIWWLNEQPVAINRAKVLQSGRFERTSEDDPTTTHLVQSTDTIEARLGSRFGLRYVVAGNPKGRPIGVDVIWRFPQPGAWDSMRHVFRSQEVYPRQLPLGDTSVSTYHFDHPWELKSGEWEFELWFKNHKLIAKRFVVRAQEGR